ncbi:hypothetical protein [Phycicoccus sp.]|uniref:hypothetical protein n=1 Tax=Phycicoccus sp. TaxID=1902410 RepID=UPI002C283AFE|nr:hypothetical protein [Phycicoccus sp.]HMM97241.1 hypothetical protein [Phycicoccus sp.]
MRHRPDPDPTSDPTPRGGGGGSWGHRGPGGRRGPGGGPGGRRGFGHGRPGGWQQGDLPNADDAAKWFTGRLPDGWFDDVEVTVDREEITVVGTLAGLDPATDAAEAEGRVSRFRAETREQRMAVADEAQARYGRTVSWGARVGDTTTLFTHLAVPVMTRLRQPERSVLDTLVDAGVARSRSDALAWCVRLVGDHAETWLGELREAMTEVDKLRAKGPEL